MISKPYLPSQIQNLTYEENLVKHYKKLEEIQKEDRKKRNVEKEVAGKVKLTESREKIIKFHISEKTNAIEKDNELLLGRLVEISRKKPAALSQVKSENTLPRTLNGPSRRREKNRIAAENEAFARRLLSQQPSFNPKKLENDYEKHHQRVKNMAKLSFLSPRKVRLPPIKYADYDNTKDNKKSVKNAKKEKKMNQSDEYHPRDESPVKTDGNEDIKSKPVIQDSQSSRTQDVKADNQKTQDVKVDHQSRQDAEVDNQKTSQVNTDKQDSQVDVSSKPTEDHVKPASSVVEDNNNTKQDADNNQHKSEVLQENLKSNSANNNESGDENKNASNDIQVDAKQNESSPADEKKPEDEQIQDETDNNTN